MKKDLNIKSTFHQAVAKWKDVLILGLCFMLLFTAFLSIQNLQSSLHQNKSLGFSSLAVIYISFMFSSLLVSTNVQRFLGFKWSIIAAMFGYAIYIVANFWPSWWTIMPASLLIGTSGAPLWAASSSYLTSLSRLQATRIGCCKDILNTNYLGVLLVFFQSGHVWGNLLISAVLKSTDNPFSGETQCGIHSCPHTTNNIIKNNTGFNVTMGDSNGFTMVTVETLNILLGSLLACSLLAIFICGLFLEDVPNTSQTDDSMERESTCTSAFQTIAMLQDIKLWSMIPLTIAMGLSEGLVIGTFTEAFVSCEFGVPSIGYVMIAWGLSGGLSSLIVGWARKHFSRIVLSAIAFSIQLTVIILLLSYADHRFNYASVIIIAAVWAVPRYIHKPVLLATYGELFPSKLESGFSNYFVWESAGLALAFLLGIRTCVIVRFYVLLAIFLVGVLCYFLLECKLKCRTANTELNSSTEDELCPGNKLDQRNGLINLSNDVL